MKTKTTAVKTVLAILVAGTKRVSTAAVSFAASLGESSDAFQIFSTMATTGSTDWAFVSSLIGEPVRSIATLVQTVNTRGGRLSKGTVARLIKIARSGEKTWNLLGSTRADYAPAKGQYEREWTIGSLAASLSGSGTAGNKATLEDATKALIERVMRAEPAIRKACLLRMTVTVIGAGYAVAPRKARKGRRSPKGTK